MNPNDVTILLPHIEERKALLDNLVMPMVRLQGCKVVVIPGEDGIAQKLNRTMKDVGTEWFFVCADDVILQQDCILSMCRMQGETGADVVHSWFTEIDHPRTGDKVAFCPDIDPFKMIHCGNCVSHMSLQRVSTFLGYDESLKSGIDWDHFIRVMLAGSKFALCRRVLFHAIYRGDGITKRGSKNDVRREMIRRYSLEYQKRYR